LRSHAALGLERVYTQLEAPVGELGMETLSASTGSLAAGDPGDAIFQQQCTAQLSQLGSQRDALTTRMQNVLSGADFGHQAIDPAEARSLTSAGEEILKRALATKELCN
jgi:hypothetical protein